MDKDEIAKELENAKPAQVMESDKPKRSRRRKVLTYLTDEDLDALPSSSKIYTSRVKTFEKIKAELQYHAYDLFEKVASKDDSKSAIGTTDDPLSIQVNEDSPKETSELETVVIEDEKVVSPSKRPCLSRSPSPPPCLTHPQRVVRNSKTQKLLNKINLITNQYHASQYMNLSLPSTPIDSGKDDDDDLVLVHDNREILLKIRWQCSIFKIPIKLNEKLITIFPKLSSICNCLPSELFLALQDTTLNPDRTPADLKISIADILDCYVLAPQKDGDGSEVIRNAQIIQLKVQSKDAKRPTIIEMNKVDPMSVLMEKYSKVCGIPQNNMNFYFDGDLISASDMPMDLDLEDGCCIDVKVKQ